MKRASKKLILLLVFCVPTSALAQSEHADEMGIPFFHQHFSAQEYRAAPQNWAVVEDPRGFIYVGNKNGVLEYDGESWRIIETANTTVRSLAVDDSGKIYVGAQADFGYLAPDTTGTLQYVSLLDEVSSRDYGFTDVWGTHVTPDGVFFQSRSHLFKWNNERLTSWESEEGYHTSFLVDGEVYVRDMSSGLLRMREDSLRVVPGGEHFVNLPVYFLAEHGSGELIAGTRRGFFLYDGDAFTPFPTDLDSVLEDFSLYHGCVLSNGSYALSLLGGGVYILDQEGHLEQILDETGELPENGANHVFQDSRGGLWVALHNAGVVRADIRSPLSIFGNNSGLRGVVNFITRHEEDLYAATGSGVYHLNRRSMLNPSRQERTGFEPVIDITQAWQLLSLGDLFIGSDQGVYRIGVGERGFDHFTGQPVYSLLNSELLPDQILLGRRDGLARLERSGDEWTEIPPSLVDTEIRSIVQVENGALWLGTRRQSVLKVELDEEGEPHSVREFGAEHGLPNADLYVRAFEGEPLVISRRGVLRFDSVKQEFIWDRQIVPEEEGEHSELYSFVEGPDNQAWLTYRDRIEILMPQSDSTYARYVPSALRFPKGDFIHTYLEDDGVAWISSNDQLIRYDPRYQKSYDYTFPVYVRSIDDLGTGEALYGGAPREGGAAAIEVPYGQRNVSISYAAAEFNRTVPIQYQYRLVGTQEEWSDWTVETQQVFTDLWEGDYRFEVRARNERGIVAETSAIDFKVLPPWYRTAWAYLLYVVGAAALLVGARRYRQLVRESQRAKRQAKELANERLANERLRQANESLEQANKLKDNFLANTSHELRTPLTAILGFTSVLREEVSEEHQEFLNIIEENGERLLRTLNSLLDIAKIRAGVTEVAPEKVDVGSKAREAVRLLQSLAERKGLDLHYRQPREPAFAMLDAGCLDRVLQNLVGNAIKFTEEGEVIVKVLSDSEHVKVRISDTGVGIREDFIPHLFDEFKQESTGISRTHEGSGLGLAITARLVELMDGHVDVESTKGEGSVFTVVFPRYVEQEEPVAS